MKTENLLFVLGALIILGFGVSAYSTYGAPSEFGNESTTTCYVGGDDGIVTCIGNLTGSFIMANLSWSYLYDYPVACPDGYAVTQIDDSITCTRIAWMDYPNIGDLNVTGNITADTYFGDGSELTGITGGNFSWNETYANSKYVNGTINSTQMEVNTGVVTILVSWLQGLFYTEAEVDGIISGINTTSNIQELLNDTGIYSTYNATYDAKVSMDYTNVAMENETNTFTENQTIQGDLKIGTDGGICNNGTDMWFVVDRTQAIIDGEYCT